MHATCVSSYNNAVYHKARPTSRPSSDPSPPSDAPTTGLKGPAIQRTRTTCKGRKEGQGTQGRVADSSCLDQLEPAAGSNGWLQRFTLSHIPRYPGQPTGGPNKWQGVPGPEIPSGTGKGLAVGLHPTHSCDAPRSSDILAIYCVKEVHTHTHVSLNDIRLIF